MNQNTDEHNSEPVKEGMDRRNFLKLAGFSALGGATTAMLPDTLHAKSLLEKLSDDAGMSDSKYWKTVRKAFVLDSDKVYMNIGSTGSTPKSVLENYNYYNQLVARDPWEMGGEWGGFPYVTDFIETLAPQFGANSDELILSRNTTDGMCTILGGLNLNAGDEILTTHHEHLAATSPMYVLRDRYGVTINEIEIPTHPTAAGDIVDLFERNITRQTRLIVCSHITYKTGIRLPVREICEMAATYGISTLIDGAHAVGMLDLDFHDIGCDFYAGSGHKWQCGPGASGILYVRNQGDNLPEHWPINSSLYAYYGMGKDRGKYNIATQLQYVGNDNYPAKRALYDSCEMWQTIGRKRIEEYVLSLSSYCKQTIQRVFGDTAALYAPDIEEFSSGITSFNPFENTSDYTAILEFRDRLREEYGFIIRYTNFHISKSDADYTYAMRISTHLFNSFSEVDALVDAMYDLYRNMAS